jgi:hypothetical protein
MMRFIHRSLLAACVLTGAMLVAAPSQAQQPVCANGECRQWPAYTPTFNSNYMTPGYCGAMQAPLYVSPGGTPPWVGHTYITYQPLAPHNQLYPHYNSYHRYYDQGRGLTRTRVIYPTPVFKTMALYTLQPFKLAR